MSDNVLIYAQILRAKVQRNYANKLGEFLFLSRS